MNTMIGLKIKDLSPETTLEGLKIKTSNGTIGYWRSQWNKGVWFSDGETDKRYPYFVESLAECLEWEVTDEPINLK
jgi:hypothetical protein